MLISKHAGKLSATRGLVRAVLRAATLIALSVGTVPAQSAPFDHSLFDGLLRKYVTRGLVDYEAFARAPEFPRYLESLDRAHPETLDDDERLAFWINAFNAYTIQLVVAHHETESIRNINKTFGVLRLNGPWTEPIVRVGGKRYTLDDVHHRILRKDFGEARVHFTLACGAVSCPSLRGEAYTGARLLSQFESQAREFLRDSPDKNSFERRNVRLSPILLSYRGDFGPAREDLAKALAPYFDGDTRTMLQQGRVFFRETPFDWSLNSVARAKTKHLPDSAGIGHM